MAPQQQQSQFTVEDAPSAASGGFTVEDAPDTRSLWERAKANFNAATQGPQPGDNPIKAFAENVGMGGGKVLRAMAPWNLPTTVSNMFSAPNIQTPADAAEALFGPTGHFVRGLFNNPGEAIGEAGTGAILGEAASPVISRVISPVLKRGTEILTGTGPKATATAAEAMQESNAANAAEATRLKGIEDQRTQLQNQYNNSSQELRGRIETARNNALKEGNAKYSAVNEALNPLTADMEAVSEGMDNAVEKLKGSPTVPEPLKGMIARIGKGDALTYKDLQGYYSELGKELSKGTLAGDNFTALDTAHEAVGNEMQRLADSQDMGQQLQDSRNYWRRMKQTFGKPQSIRDAASQTLRAIAPGFVKEDAVTNRLRLLGNFDPEIPNVANQVTEAQKGLKALPKPSTTPTPEPQTMGLEDIRQAKQQGLQTRAEDINTKGQKLLNYAVGLHAAWDAMRGNLESLPRDVAVGVGAKGIAYGISKTLQNPYIQEFLTNPTARDIATIPPDVRGNLPSLVEAAEKQGIHVHPAVAAAAGLTGASATGNY